MNRCCYGILYEQEQFRNLMLQDVTKGQRQLSIYGNICSQSLEWFVFTENLHILEHLSHILHCRIIFLSSHCPIESTQKEEPPSINNQHSSSSLHHPDITTLWINICSFFLVSGIVATSFATGLAKVLLYFFGLKEFPAYWGRYCLLQW